MINALEALARCERDLEARKAYLVLNVMVSNDGRLSMWAASGLTDAQLERAFTDLAAWFQERAKLHRPEGNA